MSDSGQRILDSAEELERLADRQPDAVHAAWIRGNARTVRRVATIVALRERAPLVVRLLRRLVG